MPRKIFTLLIVIIVILCGSWSVFWYVRGNISENTVVSFLEQGEGDWEFDYSDISLRGFPNRTDLVIHDLRMINQKDETDLAIGDLEILSLVYNWNDFIVSFSSAQKALIKGVEYVIDSDQPRLSLNWNNKTLIPIESLIVELNQTKIFSSEEIDMDLDSGLFAFKPDETTPNKFLVHLKSENMALANNRDQIFIKPFDFVGNGTVSLAESSSSQCYTMKEITFSSLKFDFDDFGVNLKGELNNQNGLPNGSLAMELVGEKEKFFDLLVANGLLSPLQFFVAVNLPIDSYEFQFSDGEINLLNLVSMEFSYSFPEIC